MKWAQRAAVAALVLGFSMPIACAAPQPEDPFIRSVFIKYLRVPPNSDQIRIWRQRLQFRTPIEMEAHILARVDYYERAGRNPRGFILSLYFDVLGISRPAPQEVDYWVQRLHECQSRERLAFMFITELRNPPIQQQPTIVAPVVSGPVQPSIVRPSLSAPVSTKEPPLASPYREIAPPPPTPSLRIYDPDGFALPMPLPTGPR